MCKRCGIKYYEISHLFSQWGAMMAPKVMGEKDGELDGTQKQQEKNTVSSCISSWQH